MAKNTNVGLIKVGTFFNQR